MQDHGPEFAIWLSTPNVAAAEIAVDLGYTAAVLDIEHGAFDLAALDHLVPLLRAIGLRVIAKVLAPERSPIQQALDFGADAVVIPHILNVEHARETCAFAKFPPLGDRSFAGGRPTRYQGFDNDWVREQDSTTKCYPMIEDDGAIRSISEILALPTVDGVFVGPSDLSLRRERGAYARTAGDFADLELIANAAAAAGKPWMLPAWSTAEKEFAGAHSVATMVTTMEHTALAVGLREALDQARRSVPGL
ncbi:HpcH/HpaI aldolase family protein [Rhodococcus erythropolis]|uniref:HpcH/HpaI aldolase family protein n=1 Tax=Rhodococcus erythropolis TaxID=1833 RepID=UPI001BE8F4D4|nr:aldolase/citrate lyase family protein [Rhodococcus erythropolis]MBT2268985.1 4-hydroxy-2-oxovalerate aldolase [Rhodococcus erythropolis]